MRLKKRPKSWYWGYLLGVLTTLGVVAGGVLWSASIVYSELPLKAQLHQRSNSDDASGQNRDVIVCLTGGRGRIRMALELFESNHAPLLYLSGIDNQVTIDEVLREAKWTQPINRSRVILDHISTNTIQNAEQVLGFLKKNNLKSVLVVTSSYHARRAAYIFSKILGPQYTVDFVWENRNPFEPDSWWTSLWGIEVTVMEFLKFFYAYFRLHY